MLRPALLLASAVVVAACATPAAPSAATDPAPGTTGSVPPSTGGPVATTAEVQGQPAPDFALILGDGSTFRLSDEQKPVYLVFWAEW